MRWTGEGLEELPKTKELLEEQESEGIFSRGAQLYVSLQGEEIASVGIGVDGLGRAIGPESLFAVYCSTKPLTALICGWLVENAELSWHDKLDYVFGSELAAATASLTIDDLLGHRGDLQHLRAESLIPMSPAARHRHLCRSAPGVATEIGTTAYSNYGGWWYLGRAVEHLAERPVRDLVAELITRPLGVHDELCLGFERDEFQTAADRIAINVDLSQLEPTAMLLERSALLACDPHPEPTGGYATMRALGRFYEAMQDTLAGRAQPTSISHNVLQQVALPTDGARYDEVLGRECRYGRGFMVDLTEHAFGRSCSERSFGHSGNAGSSFAFCDPDHSIVVAHLQAARIDGETSTRIRRQAVTDAIYEDLQLRH